jgi:hypothetical protein
MARAGQARRAEQGALPWRPPRPPAALLLICLALCSAAHPSRQEPSSQAQAQRHLELSIERRLQRHRQMKAAPEEQHQHTPQAKRIIKPCAPGCEQHGNCNSEEGRWGQRACSRRARSWLLPDSGWRSQPRRCGRPLRQAT